jgi:hypothetical protein
MQQAMAGAPVNQLNVELTLRIRLTPSPPILRRLVSHLVWKMRYGTPTDQLDGAPLRNGKRSLRKDKEEQSAGDELVEHTVSGWCLEYLLRWIRGLFI